MMTTVFTPAFNRGHTLPRLFESLCRQSSRAFEWLIVDDGSTDDTQKVIGELTARADFPIRYYRKANGGKHTAYNLAIGHALGDYFFCVDSDDFLSDCALSDLEAAVLQDPDAAGIIALKTLSDGKLLSPPLPNVPQVRSLIELTETYHCAGEFSIILKTAVARQLPYPVFEGERFIGELVVFDRLEPFGHLALLSRPLTICEYQPDGYSANASRLLRDNPAGYCLYFMQRIDLVGGLVQRVVMAGKYHCFGRLAGRQRSAYTGAHPVLVAACRPLGLLFLAYYHLFRGF